MSVYIFIDFFSVNSHAEHFFNPGCSGCGLFILNYEYLWNIFWTRKKDSRHRNVESTTQKCNAGSGKETIPASKLVNASSIDDSDRDEDDDDL